MDSFRPADLNPLSDQFRHEAARNVAQNIASMKSTRDLRDPQGAESPDEAARDRVELDKGGNPPRSSADAARDAVDLAGRAGLLEEKDSEVKRKEKDEAQVLDGEVSRLLARADVPAEILQASQQIVEGQMHPVRGPRSALTELKTPPDMGRIEVRPAEYAPVMDIHDTGNRPVPIEEAPPPSPHSQGT